MPVMGIIDLVTALHDQRFHDVEGTPESDWVDFKRAAYETEPDRPLRLSERGRWELCKDVTAFANGIGGCIVVGFPETDSLRLGVKVAGRIMPITVQSVDLNHYRDVLEREIYPAPQGIEMRWFVEIGNEPPAGVLLIRVPVATDRPLVLKRIVTERGDSITAVGIPFRNADRTNWYQSERIHHFLRQAERLHLVIEPPNSVENQFQQADNDISELLRLQEWDDNAVLFLQAVPEGGPSRLPNFFDQVKDSLEWPPSIRSSGFNLRSFGGSADVIAGALVARRGKDAAVCVDPDGLITVGALAVPDFLGWSLNRGAAGGLMMLNSIALVEVTLEFCRFVHDVLWPRAQPAHWTYRLVCRSFQSLDVSLASGPPRRYTTEYDWNRATSDDWNQSIQLGSSSEEDAFKIAVEMYALFGLPESSIPYSNNQKISVEDIRALDHATYL